MEKVSASNRLVIAISYPRIIHSYIAHGRDSLKYSSSEWGEYHIMNPVFGIHVGNSTACLAIYKQDDSKSCVEVIANNAGDRVTPALVTITDNENVVGAACKSLVISKWNATVTCNKRMLDLDTVDNTLNGERRVATVLINGEIFYEIPLENRTELLTPTEIATFIYRNLYEIAKSAVPGEEGDISCVLLVPRDFSEAARFKVRSAAEAVGWDVLHIVNEPSAAVLGYNLLSDKTPPPAQTVLVYRLGGHSCDATVIDLNYGMISILDTEHSDQVGGRLLMNKLTKYLADEFFRRYKLDPKESHRALTKLKLAAENCLHVLSTIESANCFVESLCEGVDFSHTMSRARLESLLFPYLTTFLRPLHTVLDRLNMTPENISTVLLCGGPLKIPRLKRHISDLFNENTTKVVSLPNGINYDEVLACGAAYQAGYIASDKMADNFLPNNVDIPILEFPVKIQVEGAQCEDCEDFQSGQPLPAHKTVKIINPEKSITITFTQIESEEIILKGEVHLEDLEDSVELTLEIDSELGIKVGVPESPDGLHHHIVKMYAYPL